MGYRQDISNYLGLRPDLRRILARAGTDLNVAQGSVWYVDAVDGQDGNDGTSWEQPLLTMNEAFQTDRVTSGDTIIFRGKILEQINTPVQVADVTIIGAAPYPRHADTQPVDPDGRSHGASWQPPASPTATTPLLGVRQQGWRFVNILFDGPSDDACVELLSTGGSGDDERDPSHAQFIGCKFANGQEGIKDTGGSHHVLVDSCEFNALTTAILTASTGIRVPSYWLIQDSHFVNNTNHIKISSNYGVVRNNTFIKHTTTAIDLKTVSSQGEYNAVYGNALGGTYSIAGGYTPGANDEWGGNWNSLSGGVTAADPA